MTKILGMRRLVHGILLVCFFLFSPLSNVYAAAEHAQFINQKAPSRLVAGETAEVTITFKNAGNMNWSKTKGYMLRYIGKNDASVWGPEKVEMPEAKEIIPGGMITFSFKINAPTEPGIYDFQWQMALDGKGNFGERSESTLIRIEDATWQSQFISQLLPNTLESNKNYKIALQYKNTGKVTWSSENGIRLIPKTAEIARIWGINSIPLPAGAFVAPGDSISFSVPVKTPASPGEYPFQWQLINDDNTKFGAASPLVNLRIEVGNSPYQSEFVYQNLRQTMVAGKQYKVTIMMKNNGQQAWRDQKVSLVSQKPANNLTWFINAVDLEETDRVNPGDLKGFTFVVVAPQEPGVYPMQWQLYAKGKGFFGQPSEMAQIRVVAE